MSSELPNLHGESVQNEWEMICPVCGSDEGIAICAYIWVKLTPDGTDTDDVQNHDHEWDSDSAAACEACNRFQGTVGDFQRAYEEAREELEETNADGNPD